MEVAKGKLTVIAHVACNNTKDSVELAKHAESLGVDAIAAIACNNTKDSVELAKHAESLGVDAIAAIPPIYFHLPEYAIADYWNAMSAAAPNTDFVIYNIPQLAGVALTMNLFAKMRENPKVIGVKNSSMPVQDIAAPNTDFVIYNIPQLAGVALTMNLFAKMRENPKVIGVKNSSMPVQDIQMFKAAAGEDYIIFNGPDEQFISGRVIGAEAGIGGTYGVMPELFLKMDELVKENRLDEAREVQYAANEVIYKMCSCHGNMYAVIKEILRINDNLDLGSVRAPLAELIEEDMPIVREAAEMIRVAREKYIK